MVLIASEEASCIITLHHSEPTRKTKEINVK
jgi:hypothetical protein